MPQIFKSPLDLANTMARKRPNFEVGRLDENGQVIDADAQFFDDEDAAIAFADQNGFDYVTGYTYKEGDDNPKSSYDVWTREK